MPRKKKSEANQEAAAVKCVPEKPKGEILVTGAAGVLAQETISRLHEKYRIVAVDFRRAVEIGDDIPSYKVDFLKRGLEDIFRKHDIKAVIHLGRIGTNPQGGFLRYNGNVIGTQKLFDLCVKYKVDQVIVLSSFFVYGANAYNPALLNEDTPLKASDLTLDLIDSVELENLSNIYMYKYPGLHMAILRPCNIAGPGVRNNIGRLLSRKVVPVLWGFNPVMQFIHVKDAAEAIVLAYEKKVPGVYNIAPEDWVAYKDVLARCGIKGVAMPSIPPALPRIISRTFRWKSFPSYLINYFKYPTIIDGGKFARTFGFKPRRSLEEIFTHYREMKKRAFL
ncbi:MAG: SDR family oxidoreductase [Deltaproteobacteria bacterium]|nr:SDR family oxidoreductase [Deltaproteobacteria bacterium]